MPAPPLPCPPVRRFAPVALLCSLLLVLGGLTGAAGPASASAPRQAVTGAAASLPAVSLRAAADGEARLLPRGVTRRGVVGSGRRPQALPDGRVAAPPPAALTAAPVSRFTIEFVNGSRTWSEQAKAAFRAGTDVWSRSLESPVPIVVRATAMSFGDPEILGGASPTDFLRDDRGTRDSRDDVFEPVALVNARDGVDMLPGESDIEADFNPTAPDLYLGTDGRPGADQIDFRTVVMHEIAHGLGLVGSAVLDDGRASVGLTDPRTGIRTGVSYDQLTYTTSPAQAGTGGSRILSLPDGSPALRSALTGGQLYWAGQQALTASGSRATPRRTVRLFAPSTYVPGSTYGHLDEASYPRRDPDALMTPVLATGESFAGPGPVALGMLADLGFLVPALSGSAYTAIEPVRLLDTREGTGAPRRRVGAGETIDLAVAGVAGVPQGASAVVLNLTAVAPSSDTDIRAYPTPVTSSPVPVVSNLNLARGQTRANLVTVPVGNNGRIRLRNAAGAVSLVADLSGWFAGSAEERFTPVDPVRLLDTRAAIGAPAARVEAGKTVDLQVAGNGPVPGQATSVVLTVTAVGATRASDVRVYPAPAADGPAPTVSNVNVADGGAVPNVIIVKVGAGGRVRLFNAAGRVDLLADVAGYFTSGTGGELFRPATPTRVLDTRTRLGTSGVAPTRVPAGQAVRIALAGGPQVPSTASAAVLNVTGVGATASTDVRVFPGDAASVPTVSNLNLRRGQTAADLVVVRLGGGRVLLRHSSGEVALVADVAGWFGPAS